MQHWSQLATRNWRAKPVRTLGAVFAIALGTAAVVWVTCCYESVRRTTLKWSSNYVGNSQITVECAVGKYDIIPERIIEALRELKEIRALAPRLVQRLWAEPRKKNAVTTSPSEQAPPREEIDFHGIDLTSEFEVRGYTLTGGRMLGAGDRYACVLEEGHAREEGLDVGDFIRVWGAIPEQPYELEIVGLIERRRIARFQKGLCLVRLDVLQEMTTRYGSITSVDIVLHDGSQRSVGRTQAKIRPLVRKFAANANVSTAESRMRQIDKAQSQLQLVLTLLSCVAMLTALFIILSTLSMGMIERISQLGLMRCIGVTGRQLAALMFTEVLPLGFIGVLAGVPLGLALTWITVLTAPTYVGTFALSWTGIILAVAAGLLTTLLAAALPAFAALTVSPLEASRPRARRASPWLIVAAAVLAVLVLGAQQIVLNGLSPGALAAVSGLLYWLRDELGINLEAYARGVQRAPSFVAVSATAVILLYAGYALLGPLIVRLAGVPVVALTAALTRVRVRLMQDQIGHAVWRSAGICCGMMVGLSLIVGLVVFSQSIRGAWEFPKQFPEAYVWNFSQMRPDAAAEVAKVRGIREFTAANAVNVIVEEGQRPLLMQKVLLSVTWFLGCDPDSFFQLLKPDILEPKDADLDYIRARLKEGGNVVVAKDFAITRAKKVGDTVKVWLPGQPSGHNFNIVAIIDSPALDIAATYFQAQSEMHVAAVGSVLGANADLDRVFGIAGTKLVLINFGLPPEPVPPDWPPPRGSPAARDLPRNAYDEEVSLARRWQAYREEKVLREVKDRLDAPTAFSGTVRELKDEIERQLNGMTRLLAAVPVIALIVAAIGVANLMTANVTSRARQLAVLRAVGATRGLIVRMVVGEALVLGLLGSAMGWVLGLHLARNTTLMTERMWGLQVELDVPVMFVAIAIALSIGLSVVAGVLPARHAARTNIVDALHAV